ncbi:hypothetical protein C8R46DRAFT_1358348 [Mycena filopes]|nr:hypothetical protein C8R46DRAFT_1358346 [Mycena filopes]KAJ7150244.1 hypothetical protein C8R46DRAFT_1358348 [Mycena filopes]
MYHRHASGVSVRLYLLPRIRFWPTAGTFYFDSDSAVIQSTPRISLGGQEAARSTADTVEYMNRRLASGVLFSLGLFYNSPAVGRHAAVPILEKVTHGLVKAPLHRVVSPTQGTRYSVGYFQGVSMDTRVADTKFEFPQELLDMKRARQEREGDTTEFRFTESDKIPAGEGVLNFKLRAHPLVTYKYYPELFPKFFPDGLPAKYAQEAAALAAR